MHRELPFKVDNICRRIMTHLRNLVLAGHLGPDQWSGSVPRAYFMSAQPNRSRINRVERVQWRPPDQPWLKLNTDGAFVAATSRAGGGGLLRNNLGEIVEAFCTPLEAESGWEAELMALREGVTMAKRHSRHIWIETDAETLSAHLGKGRLGPASSRHLLAEIRLALRDTSWRVSFIPREGNKAADHLASLGKDGDRISTFTAESAPARVRALARLDQMGLPNFRFS